MFQLLTTICFIGGTCLQAPSPIAYETAESCFHQSAIIAGAKAGPTGIPYAWRTDCRIETELGLTTLSTTGSNGADLPVEFSLDGFAIGLAR